MPISRGPYGVPLLLLLLFTGAAALSVKPPQAPKKIAINIKSFASLGDSYASGIDAGQQLDSTCWRYSESYPAQLKLSDLLRGHAPTMQFLACSGAVMTSDWGLGTAGEVGKRKEIWSQISAMKKADFATLSIGGNDAGFFDMLNGCLFKFHGPAAPNCEKAKKVALERIRSHRFKVTYNMVLDSILRRNPASSFRIFANGYSKFFDDALTPECNHISLGYWIGFQPKLTVELRRELNELCDILNERIGQIIQERGDERVIWVNWAPRFEQHRLCRPGEGLADENSWFYGVGFRGITVNAAEASNCDFETKAAPGDWGTQALCGIAVTHANHPELKPVPGDFQVTGGRENLGPKYARVFHPKPRGYKAIVDQIREVWPYTPVGTAIEVDEYTKERCGASGGEEGTAEPVNGLPTNLCGHDIHAG